MRRACVAAAILLASGMATAQDDAARRRDLVAACAVADAARDLDALGVAAARLAEAFPGDAEAAAWRRAAEGLRAAREALAKGLGSEATWRLENLPPDVAPELRKAVVAERDALREKLRGDLEARRRGDPDAALEAARAFAKAFPEDEGAKAALAEAETRARREKALAGLPEKLRAAVKKRPDRDGILDGVIPALELEGHKGSVYAATFSPDGKLLATACQDHDVRLFEALTGRELAALEAHSGNVWTAVFSPDGRLLVSAGEDAVRVWDVATRREVKILPPATTIALGPGGRLAAPGEKNTAVLLDLATGQEAKRFAGHAETVISVALSPDGRTLATVGRDKTARLWDVAKAKEIRRLGEVSRWSGSAVFSHDGKTVATTHGEEKVVRLWETATGRERRTLAGHEDHVWSAAFSPDGKLVATASADKTARLWEAATGRELRAFRGHQMALASAQFSPDGRLLVTAGHDRAVKVWVVP